ncbi:MAG: HEAT repeat domain-containing protein [Acidobacteria bacterium]|nr:MAG: HEAT repeat domain-containing protein [Acidobacteriota bacterium]
MHSKTIMAVALAAALLIGCGVDEQAIHENVSRIQSIGEKEGGSEEEILFLLDRLENGNAEERTGAAWALGRSGGQDAVEALSRAAQKDSDTYVRVNAIKALTRFSPEAVRDVLVQQLAADEEEIQVEALKALGAERYVSEYHAVGAMCQSESAAIRSIAADTLVRMGNAEALTYLGPMTSDPDKEVRNIVAFALGKLGDDTTIALLAPMLQDEEWEVRANAALALGRIGHPSARPALEGVLEDGSNQVRFAAQKALKTIG